MNANIEVIDAIQGKINFTSIGTTANVDLNDYYTKDETDYQIDKAIEELDIESNVYVGIEEPKEELIWIKTDETYIQLDDYATKNYVDEKFDNIDIPEVDLNNYYSKNEVDNLIPDTTGFITMDDVEEKGYQTKDQVNDLINTALGVIENGTY